VLRNPRSNERSCIGNLQHMHMHARLSARFCFKKHTVHFDPPLISCRINEIAKLRAKIPHGMSSTPRFVDVRRGTGRSLSLYLSLNSLHTRIFLKCQKINKSQCILLRISVRRGAAPLRHCATFLSELGLGTAYGRYGGVQPINDNQSQSVVRGRTRKSPRSLKNSRAQAHQGLL
jgi:hypothetical protein